MEADRAAAGDAHDAADTAARDGSTDTADAVAVGGGGGAARDPDGVAERPPRGDAPASAPPGEAAHPAGAAGDTAETVTDTTPDAPTDHARDSSAADDSPQQDPRPGRTDVAPGS
jgi:hypothetical protein